MQQTAPEAPVSAWDRVKLARNPKRPHTLDYLHDLVADFVELHGDRTFGDDQALIGGIGKFDGRSVMILGHQKGSDTRENLKRNFGMARPEGYRKAERLMRHAEKFRMPVITFIDTSGADPTLGSEERGQAIAIAESLVTMAGLRVPIVATVIGEGGSGGALAIGVADRVLMLENSVYSVASPEGSASILWKDAAKAPEAAERMRITAHELLEFGIIDEVIAEPAPAHENARTAIRATGQAISRHLRELIAAFPLHDDEALDRLVAARYTRFRSIGSWQEESAG
ncbi:MAG: acetyl-CoA carboxylase carboxyltransferase subunit alpha [Thermomicrobiales bacterium]|nr:acetyl-CoA carboxylase carboxyltransferase subunit alpha [Thermomicrobiales bacterium]